MLATVSSSSFSSCDNAAAILKLHLSKQRRKPRVSVIPLEPRLARDRIHPVGMLRACGSFSIARATAPITQSSRSVRMFAMLGACAPTCCATSDSAVGPAKGGWPAVVSEVDRRHSALAELRAQRIAIGKSLAKRVWKRGGDARRSCTHSDLVALHRLHRVCSSARRQRHVSDARILTRSARHARAI